MSGENNINISGLEEIAKKKNKLLSNYPVICIGALKCLERNDIKGFSDKLDERQLLLDSLTILNNEFSIIRESLSDGYGTIVDELTKTGAENMICPDWCKSLQKEHFKARKLTTTCKILNSKLYTRANSFQNGIIQSINSLRSREKVRGGYMAAEKNYKGSAIYCISN